MNDVQEVFVHYGNNTVDENMSDDFSLKQMEQLPNQN